MDTKMERMSLYDQTVEALSDFPSAVKRVTDAAAASLEAAKSSRARTRRERMVMRSATGIPRIRSAYPPEELTMPDDWKDDEDTRKIAVPSKE